MKKSWSILSKLRNEPLDLSGQVASGLRPLSDEETFAVVGGMMATGGHTSSCSPYGADDCSAVVQPGPGSAA